LSCHVECPAHLKASPDALQKPCGEKKLQAIVPVDRENFAILDNRRRVYDAQACKTDSAKRAGSDDLTRGTEQ
jgi:hypothetical protein